MYHENGHAQTGCYILYREQRKRTREMNALIDATINMFSDYLGDKDWYKRMPTTKERQWS